MKIPNFDLSRLNILLIDDVPDTRFVIADLFETFGATVTPIESAQPAPTVYDLIDSKAFNLVSLDFQMPKIDGYQIMRKIRGHSDPTIRDLPVVAITARAKEDDKRRILASGVNHYFTKPFDQDTLLAALEEFAKKVKV